jgi:GNAT superfamily N-acetyltransferase
MELVAAAGDLLAEILDGSYPLWGEGLTRQAYEKYNVAQQATLWGRHHLDRVALVHEGRLLSSAKRYSLELLVDGRRCPTLGIGAVFTPPELRGNGYARELLARLVDAGLRGGHDLALLFSEIGPRYYAEQGFSVVPCETLGIDVDRKPGGPAIMARGGEARDVPAIAAMQDEIAPRYRLSVVRPVQWIEYALAKKQLLAGLAPDGACGVLFYVVEEGGCAVAYVVLTTSTRAWTLEECGDRDPSGARVGALLQMLLAREPAVGVPPIYAWLPAGWLPPQLSIVSRAAAHQVMMLRPLSEAGRVGRPLAPADVLYWHADAF